MILGGILAVGAIAIWSSYSSDGSPSTSTSSAPRPAVTPVVVAPAGSRVVGRRTAGQTRPGEWKPPLASGTPIDPQKVDPTLRLDLLAKVQQVEVSVAQRNVFQFGEASKPVDKTPLPVVKPIIVAQKTPPAPIAPPGPPPAPTAPPIALKYYGFANPRTSTRKKAFFLDGEDIIVASEGELIKKRYRLVKIGVNSVTMEDTQFSSQQTLPLADEAAAAG